MTERLHDNSANARGPFVLKNVTDGRKRPRVAIGLSRRIRAAKRPWIDRESFEMEAKIALAFVRTGSIFVDSVLGGTTQGLDLYDI